MLNPGKRDNLVLEMIQLACFIKEKINTRHHHFLTFRNGQKVGSRHLGHITTKFSSPKQA